MAFLGSIRNTDLKENIGVLTNVKNENVGIGSAKAKKKTILCDVANTVNGNRNTPVSVKKTDITHLKATVSRTPFNKNLPMKTNEFTNLLFRDKIENSAPPRIRCHKPASFDEYDTECKHCLKYNGINDSITPTLTMLDCEKLTSDPFPTKNKISKNKKPNFKEELIVPFVGDDFLADIGMLPSPTISSFTFEEIEENCFEPIPSYNSDSD
ncbi:hypothetical protein LSTR_LSTR003566 [Laodelphax striatellus]|uniref:Uncharacterized protein n=1 Tax=Laodelphax striatellus TaxID=195883 RepID=A0A482WLP4_LAOST|nr:hypothetical protein LSTR_LSTR003566 [Laodelphax striatellus]